jgi:heat shock protein HslJ
MVMAYPGGVYLMDENEPTSGRFKTVAGILLIAVAVVVLLVFLFDLTAQPATLSSSPNWTLVSYRDVTGILIPVINTGDITARFERGGNVTGFSGCNQYVAAYLKSGDQMRITFPLHTSLTCTDAGIMQQEKTYFNNLAETASIRAGPSEINILDSRGNTLLVFRSA